MPGWKRHRLMALGCLPNQLYAREQLTVPVCMWVNMRRQHHLFVPEWIPEGLQDTASLAAPACVWASVTAHNLGSKREEASTRATATDACRAIV